MLVYFQHISKFSVISILSLCFALIDEFRNTSIESVSGFVAGIKRDYEAAKYIFLGSNIKNNKLNGAKCKNNIFGRSEYGLNIFFCY